MTRQLLVVVLLLSESIAANATAQFSGALLTAGPRRRFVHGGNALCEAPLPLSGGL
jgi:hypothetical protein